MDYSLRPLPRLVSFSLPLLPLSLSSALLSFLHPPTLSFLLFWNHVPYLHPLHFFALCVVLYFTATIRQILLSGSTCTYTLLSSFLHLLTFLYPGGCGAALSSPPHLALVHLQIPLGKSSGTTAALCRWLLSSEEAGGCCITLYCNSQFCCRILTLTSLQRIFCSAVLNNLWSDAFRVFVMIRRHVRQKSFCTIYPISGPVWLSDLKGCDWII